MSPTMGSGPFGHRPAGRFNLDIPVTQVLFVIRLRAGSARLAVARR